MLKKVMNVSKDLNIPIFLSSGTLLGYYREKNFIKHDYDIDLGIYKEDYTDDLIYKMESAGFNLYRTLGTKEKGLELSFRYPNTKIGKLAKLDIFLHYKCNKDKNIYWTTYLYPKFEKEIKYKISNFELVKDKFVGVEVYVPKDTEKYLVQHYGHDWKTPKKSKDDYYYAVSPVSIVDEDQVEQEDIEEV